MVPEVTTRYEQHTTSIGNQLAMKLRRIFPIERAEYAVKMTHRIVGGFGHVASTALYEAMRTENRNGPAIIQVANNTRDVYPRSRPYFRSLQCTSHSSSSNANSSSRSSSSQTSMSTTPEQQDSQQPKNATVWATIRHLAIYRRNGA